MHIKRIVYSILFLTSLVFDKAHTQVHSVNTNMDSSQITEYHLGGLQTVFGRTGLTLAQARDTVSKGLHHNGDMTFFRIEVKKLFALAANAFSEERIRDLSERNCALSTYLYFDTSGVNLENYFFINKGQSFKAGEICILDGAIKENLTGWFAKPGYTEWLLKRRKYLLTGYTFSFRELCIFRRDGKTFPRWITEIPESLQTKPQKGENN
ncbi:hypothetical protein M1D52_02415 [Olivibacter sp. SA151]|uniref:hypothetical protein n=1 Tax=Olivibacter jilunii TaxID=985016 RepID=UPI003F136AA0